MAKDKSKIDKTQDVEGSAAPEAKIAKGGALSSLSRKVSDADLRNKAVVRLILDRTDQLEQEVQKLSRYKEDYYERDKDAAVLLEKLHAVEDSINMKSVVIAIGGILAGFLPSLWDKQRFFWMAAIIAILFLLFGFLKKTAIKSTP